MSDRMQQARATAESAKSAATARALLQVWFSPSFPVGAFAYSHGLEKAVENGWIADRASLEAWIADLVALGSLRNDLILLAAAWRATTSNDHGALCDAADLAAALQPSAERYLEATQQGASFIAHVETAWPADARTWVRAAGDRTPAYPVAVGFAAAAHAIPLPDTLDAYAVAFTGTLTSAAIRLGVIGQTDAQRITAALLDRLLAAAAAAVRASLDDVGGATWRSDLASMQHETQYSRLFRS